MRRTRRLALVLALASLACGKKQEGPAKPVELTPLDASVPPLVEAYAEMLVEVGERAEAARNAASRGAFLPSPAIGSKLASDPKVLEVAVTGFVGYTFRSLHGNAPVGVETVADGDPLTRGGDRVALLCPSAFSEDPLAADVHLWRSGPGHVVATVRAEGVCAWQRRTPWTPPRLPEEPELLAMAGTLLEQCARGAAKVPNAPAPPVRLDLARADYVCRRESGEHGLWGDGSWRLATTSKLAGTLESSPLLVEGPTAMSSTLPLAPQRTAEGLVTQAAGRWKWFGKHALGGYHPAPRRAIVVADSGDWRAIWVQAAEEGGAAIEIALYAYRGKERLTGTAPP